MNLKVGIIDYGMGNLRSVSNAVQAVGSMPDYVTDPDKLRLFDRLILPGVGAFRDAMIRLNESGMAQSLDEQADAGKPVLGLCLGMQLMCSSSEEGGYFKGLNWFDANVERFPQMADLKIPHIGWNNILPTKEHNIFKDVTLEPDVYFVHSYRANCANHEDVLAWCDYGEPFAAIIGRENRIGIQFHPEKSQRVGLQLLRNFLEEDLCSKNA